MSYPTSGSAHIDENTDVWQEYLGSWHYQANLARGRIFTPHSEVASSSTQVDADASAARHRVYYHQFPPNYSDEGPHYDGEATDNAYATLGYDDSRSSTFPAPLPEGYYADEPQGYAYNYEQYNMESSLSAPATPASPSTFNALSSSALAPLLSHYQSVYSKLNKSKTSTSSASNETATSTSAWGVEEDTNLSSDTLHQHACAKQRRSRHDPGGGTSQGGKPHTPKEQATFSSLDQEAEKGKYPPPTSDAVGPASSVGAREKGKMVVRHRSPSPMAHLPYPEDAAHGEAQRIFPTMVTPGPSTPDICDATSSSTATPNSVISDDGMGYVKQTIVYSPRTGRRAAIASGEIPEGKVKPKRGTPVRIACLFCRRRKIGCGGPVGLGEDKTCKQCANRHLVCTYPEETHRGKRTKR
ncbi:unnamed protein product [Somion occarium]|uniref:Zn(2)-C6 fungal-type domain-containing protein n=1 Tax=Somion occarium TaxID=3059160 RepID=A0ABP1DDM1_9APHY